MEHKLVQLGRLKFSQPPGSSVSLMSEQNMNALINDLENTPHAFVLACLMDRQIKAERAWCIPYYIKEQLGSFEIEKLCSISLAEYIHIFEERKLHRFNDTMAKCFYDAVHRIAEVYDGNVSKIWSNKPSSQRSPV